MQELYVIRAAWSSEFANHPHPSSQSSYCSLVSFARKVQFEVPRAIKSEDFQTKNKNPTAY